MAEFIERGGSVNPNSIFAKPAVPAVPVVTTLAWHQCRMGRAVLKLDIKTLAHQAQVSPNTIARLERGEKLNPVTQAAIRATLERNGVRFSGASWVGFEGEMPT